ncbi:MAG TPA: CusA/CzcA family heavy metal efflux RND transporter [Kofleriaceae bacterium]|nr:CusA/CzcA family heavy metal efflux RND transporter [Kofleriaceae bacterium]
MQRIVGFALRYRAAILLMGVALVVTGLFAFRALPIEAYPNPVPPLVEVIAQPPGWSAEESERYVTVPLEIGLSGMPELDHIRSQSLFGLVDVKCYFKWGIDYKDARQEVINRLQFIPLPNGVQASISPWNAIGEIFRYQLVDRDFEARKAKLPPDQLAAARAQSLLKLKTIEDWVLERQWKQVPGVIDVTSFGGLSKQYHVEVDPNRLKARGVTLQQVTAAIANANQNVGGQRIEMGEQAFTVRGVGLIGANSEPATFETVAKKDIGDIVLLQQNGVAVHVRDVADVSVGWMPRLGIVGKDDDDIVQGIVLMRYGEQTKRTLDNVQERLEYIRKYVLPPEQGIEIVPYYDRGNLTHVTTHTVMENLLVGMGLVVVVLMLFLGNLRGALVTALNIPLALLVAFIGMVATGASANLISLGAVDFGIVVDSTVIMMENIFRHLGKHGEGTIRERVFAAAGEVGRPMAFSTLIIGVAFLPLFTMTGVSGVIFSPMARTYAFAIGGAIVLALTFTPAVTTYVIPATTEEKESLAMRFMHRVYKPLFDIALRRRKLACAFALAPILLCWALFGMLGGEFMPKLEEGNFWIRATLPMSVSLSEAATYTGRMRAILKKHPEVISVVSQLGRPDDGTDVAGFNNIELFAPLEPFDEWPKGLTKEALTRELDDEFTEAFPGVVTNFSQYLSDNVEEALSGVKGENSVKVFGPEIAKNENAADAIVDVMNRVKGVDDLGMFHSMGQPSIKIVPDRELLARYGLNTGDVEAVIAATIGGQAVTQVLEGAKTLDLTVRWKEAFRSSPAAIRDILVPAPDGSQIPLGQIAKISDESSPAVIFREDGQRYAPVKFSVRGRDLKSTVEDAQHQVASQVPLPPGAHLEWSGQINELKEATGRLMLIIPITLLLIAFLTYSAVRNIIDTLIVLVNIPVACAGGLLALVITGEPFSVSAAMGFISIFGIAIQGAILVVTYAQRQWAEGKSLVDGARAAAEQRFRPVLMTTLVATLGLLPAAVSHGIGSQTQKPLAIVVIGGSLMLAVLTQVLQPPLLVVAHGWFKPKQVVPEGTASPHT